MTEASTKTFTSLEVATHKEEESLWVTITPPGSSTPSVYDVTTYLDSHPGGAEVLLDVAGTDATVSFEDIGHSNDARRQLEKFKIGTLVLSAEEKEKAEKEKERIEAQKLAGPGIGMTIGVIVVLIAVVLAVVMSQQ